VELSPVRFWPLVSFVRALPLIFVVSIITRHFQTLMPRTFTLVNVLCIHPQARIFQEPVIRILGNMCQNDTPTDNCVIM
jgi:hypothetical protein